MADDDLPIDVHYDKLIDWLVDRKKVAKDWRKKLACVHAKLSELARELPGALTRAHGLGVPDASLVESGTGEPPAGTTSGPCSCATGSSPARIRGSQTPTTRNRRRRRRERDGYGRTRVVIEKEKEKTRGLFGRLTGKAKAWDDVVRAYEKDALHLPECGSTMTRATDHETPFLRREREKLAKRLVDLERRETEHRRKRDRGEEKFSEKCADVFGVTSLDIPRDEVAFRGLVDGLVANLIGLRARRRRGEDRRGGRSRRARALDRVGTRGFEQPRRRREERKRCWHDGRVPDAALSAAAGDVGGGSGGARARPRTDAIVARGRRSGR